MLATMRNEIALLNPDEILGRGEYADKTAEDFLREQQQKPQEAKVVSQLIALDNSPSEAEFSYTLFWVGFGVLAVLLAVGYWWWKKQK